MLCTRKVDGANTSVLIDEEGKIKMETSIEECIERDSKRDKKVGADVILEVATAGLWRPDLLRTNINSEKGICIVDIDGTIADCEHRRHFVTDEVKDYDSFFWRHRKRSSSFGYNGKSKQV